MGGNIRKSGVDHSGNGIAVLLRQQAGEDSGGLCAGHAAAGAKGAVCVADDVNAVALGLLEQKLKATSHEVQPGERVELRHTGIPNEIRVMIEREARRMAGYRQGRIIADEFMALLEGATQQDVDLRIQSYLDQHDDPRLAEIVNNLANACLNRAAGKGEAVHG